MIPTENKFNVGDIVVFKNHPLLYDYEIKGDGKYVPPIMIIKEVIFENSQKKTHDEVTGKKIAEKIKYICIHFDDNKSEFIESHLYESSLEHFKMLHIGRIDDPKRLDKYHENLVDEISRYPLSPAYEYSKIIYFKTKKLELLKKRTSKTVSNIKGKSEVEEKNTLQYVVSYSTPEFIITGFKKEIYNDLYFNDGKVKRFASTNFVKIQWYNPILQKFSEQFLPIECFTDIQPFPTTRLHKKSDVVKPQDTDDTVPNISNVDNNKSAVPTRKKRQYK